MTEWKELVGRYCEDTAECNTLRMNLSIQHTWALMALYLRALSASGIDNIALMTDQQRSLAMAAKVSALISALDWPWLDKGLTKSVRVPQKSISSSN